MSFLGSSSILCGGAAAARLSTQRKASCDHHLHACMVSAGVRMRRGVAVLVSVSIRVPSLTTISILVNPPVSPPVVQLKYEMYVLVPCLAVLVASAGFSQTRTVVKPSPTTPKVAPAAKTPPAVRSGTDAGIEKAIRAKLAASKISTNQFEVHVQGGVATLTGRTGVVQHKGTATRLAKSGGATKVVNRIEISEEARQKAASNLATGRRRAQVKRSELVKRSETSNRR